jgi:hypothetical protein
MGGFSDSPAKLEGGNKARIGHDIRQIEQYRREFM